MQNYRSTWHSRMPGDFFGRVYDMLYWCKVTFGLYLGYLKTTQKLFKTIQLFPKWDERCFAYSFIRDGQFLVCNETRNSIWSILAYYRQMFSAYNAWYIFWGRPFLCFPLLCQINPSWQWTDFQSAVLASARVHFTPIGSYTSEQSQTLMNAFTSTSFRVLFRSR